MKRPLTELEAFRAQELLIERATTGLDDAQTAELAALGVEDDLSFDLAAAAIDIATLRIEELPSGVADKILVASGVARPSGSLPTTLAGVAPPRPIRTIDTQRPAVSSTPDRAKKSRSATYAWMAAAACLALAVGAVVWATQRSPEVITKEVPVVQVPVTPSPADARAALLASANDLTTLAWKAMADPAAQGASGDVVWSPSRQRGYLRFVGLAPNDPAKTQYQLWIFDKQRDERYPVDGGVFDVGGNGEVIVAISAKLPVADPTLFAVTVEAPGGVVVSKRERIVVTAAPG